MRGKSTPKAVSRKRCARLWADGRAAPCNIRHGMIRRRDLALAVTDVVNLQRCAQCRTRPREPRDLPTPFAAVFLGLTKSAGVLEARKTARGRRVQPRRTVTRRGHSMSVPDHDPASARIVYALSSAENSS